MEISEIKAFLKEWPLSPKEMDALAQRAESGDAAAKEDLSRAMTRLGIHRTDQYARQYGLDGELMLKSVDVAWFGRMRYLNARQCLADLEAYLREVKWQHYCWADPRNQKILALRADCESVRRERKALLETLGQEPAAKVLAEICGVSQTVAEAVAAEEQRRERLRAEAAARHACLRAEIDGMLAEWEKDENRSAVRTRILACEPDERRILFLALGFYDGTRHSGSGAAARLGVKMERADRLVWNFLRPPKARSKRLKDFLK